MVRITGFKFAIAAALALLLTTFTVFPGASAAYDSELQAGQAARQIEQYRQSGKGQPVAIFAALNTYMRPVLWREPVDIESRDLFYGPGGRTRVRRALNGASVANARWMGNLLGRLSDKQLIDAFCAGGFNAAETSLYVSILRARIIQLQRL